jgi:hypothetical protein
VARPVTQMGEFELFHIATLDVTGFVEGH